MTRKSHKLEMEELVRSKRAIEDDLAKVTKKWNIASKGWVCQKRMKEVAVRRSKKFEMGMKGLQLQIKSKKNQTAAGSTYWRNRWQDDVAELEETVFQLQKSNEEKDEMIEELQAELDALNGSRRVIRSPPCLSRNDSEDLL